MNVTELSREELTVLKGNYLDELLQKQENRGASYGELSDADFLISDDEIYGVFAGYTFCHEDFGVIAEFN